MKLDIDKYRNVSYETRTNCMICGHPSLPSVINLPKLPMTEIYVSEKVNENIGIADQGLDFCTNCGHAQLRNVIDVELQYGETFSYFFRTGESATGRSSVQFFIDFMNRTSGNNHFKHILEVGCNDLFLLKQLQHKADFLTGVDPILKDYNEDIKINNLSVIGDFFENFKLEKDYDLLICKDTLEHVADPKEFTRQIVDQSSDETLFYFQFPCLESTLKDARFDQIFHQHLNYFTLQSVIYMLNELGCELIDFTFNHEHWGALLVAFRKSSKPTRFNKHIWNITSEDISHRYKVFKNGLATVNSRLQYFEREEIYGFGAALMLPVLSYYLENDLSGLVCIIDDDPNKDGLYYLNLPVQILSQNAIKDNREAIFLLTAIASQNNVRTILPKLFEFRPKHIIVPLNTI